MIQPEVSLDYLCEILTQRVPWKMTQDQSIIIWTEGNVDEECIDILYFLLKHKVYVKEQLYNPTANMTTTVYIRK